MHKTKPFPPTNTRPREGRGRNAKNQERPPYFVAFKNGDFGRTKTLKYLFENFTPFTRGEKLLTSLYPRGPGGYPITPFPSPGGRGLRGGGDTPTLTLPRQGGGDYEVIGRPFRGISITTQTSMQLTNIQGGKS
jgi:hypothetical protein